MIAMFRQSLAEERSFELVPLLMVDENSGLLQGLDWMGSQVRSTRPEDANLLCRTAMS